MFITILFFNRIADLFILTLPDFLHEFIYFSNLKSKQNKTLWQNTSLLGKVFHHLEKESLQHPLQNYFKKEVTK